MAYHTTKLRERMRICLIALLATLTVLLVLSRNTIMTIDKRNKLEKFFSIFNAFVLGLCLFSPDCIKAVAILIFLKAIQQEAFMRIDENIFNFVKENSKNFVFTPLLKDGECYGKLKLPADDEVAISAVYLGEESLEIGKTYSNISTYIGIDIFGKVNRVYVMTEKTVDHEG
jgi:hypothetical protein